MRQWARDEGSPVSPKWAEVAGYGLYFYYGERHQRPHVAVQRGREGATVDVVTGEVLAGELPPGVLKQVQDLLSRHRDEALRAFTDVLEHRVPRRLEEVGKEDD